jgi:hypothetical protein
MKFALVLLVLLLFGCDNTDAAIEECELKAGEVFHTTNIRNGEPESYFELCMHHAGYQKVGPYSHELVPDNTVEFCRFDKYPVSVTWGMCWQSSRMVWWLDKINEWDKVINGQDRAS